MVRGDWPGAHRAQDGRLCGEQGGSGGDGLGVRKRLAGNLGGAQELFREAELPLERSGHKPGISTMPPKKTA